MKLRALDLFSGIGGLSLALSDYVETVAYCENDRHAQAVLFSRMETNELDKAPIWDDIKTLNRSELERAGIGDISIIIGGFPCTDTSNAGRRAGLAGKHSGLFFEIVRLAREIQPQYLFIENVAGLRKRGLDEVLTRLAEIGYDCRYTFLSAADIGAPHKRERFFLLARKKTDRTEAGRTHPQQTEISASQGRLHYDNRRPQNFQLANSSHKGLEERLTWETEKQQTTIRSGGDGGNGRRPKDWSTEPRIRRVGHGIPMRVDRIKRLGNAVVPLCARIAFEKLLDLPALKTSDYPQAG